MDSLDNSRQAYVSARQGGAVGSAMIIAYLLLLFSLITTVAAAIIFFKTAHTSEGNSMLSLQSISLFTGQCDSNLQTYNLVAHFLINGLGTIVLASSNYLQQICSSPSINEIASRVGQGKDFRFGSNSPSSAFRQKATLTLVWIMLVLTSLPLHLMLNGIMGYAVTPIDAEGHAVQISGGVTPNLGGNITSWHSYSSDQCAKLLLHSIAYVTDFQNITIIINPGAPFDFYNNFMRDRERSDVTLIPKASDIYSCFVDSVPSVCELTVRWFPAVLSAGALIIKTAIVFIALKRHSHFRKRVFNSLGDIIAVGARHPHLRAQRSQWGAGMFKGKPCHKFRIRWLSALGFWDFLVAVFWWVSGLGVTAYGIYSWEVVGKGLTFADHIKRFGFGAVDPMTSLTPGQSNIRDGTPSTFPLLVIIANCPQLWLSLGYLLWNNQITRIWMEREWRSYYRHVHKPRVSYDKPKDEVGTRETRWLQLPYWLTGLLMSLNTIMHWIVSQTLFVVEILGNSETRPNFYLNFSPLAIFCIGVVATILVLGMTIYYFVPIRTWMPLMAGSGRVVFESCVRLEATLPAKGVMWGDISTRHRRLAGFGQVADELAEHAYYPSDRNNEPEYLRHRGSIYSFADSDTAPLVGRRYG
jgi:hypothetical protein